MHVMSKGKMYMYSKQTPLKGLHIAHSEDPYQLITLKPLILHVSRQELKEREAKYSKMLEELKSSHREEVESRVQQFEKEKRDLTQKLKSDYGLELLDLQKANQLAVSSLKDQLQVKQERALCEEAERHREEMAALQDELVSQHQSELSGLREGHESEVKKHRQQLQEMLEKRQKEVSHIK